MQVSVVQKPLCMARCLGICPCMLWDQESPPKGHRRVLHKAPLTQHRIILPALVDKDRAVEVFKILKGHRCRASHKVAGGMAVAGSVHGNSMEFPGRISGRWIHKCVRA